MIFLESEIDELARKSDVGDPRTNETPSFAAGC